MTTDLVKEPPDDQPSPGVRPARRSLVRYVVMKTIHVAVLTAIMPVCGLGVVRVAFVGTAKASDACGTGLTRVRSQSGRGVLSGPRTTLRGEHGSPQAAEVCTLTEYNGNYVLREFLGYRNPSSPDVESGLTRRLVSQYPHAKTFCSGSVGWPFRAWQLCRSFSVYDRGKVRA